MTVDFDPYFKWLGIPPEEQPPNYYRLLGIPLFTSDVEVIDNAADQRMAHLRSHQLGQRGQLVQKLLNEIAFVKACLQDPIQKAFYDEALQGACQTPAQMSEAPMVNTRGQSRRGRREPNPLFTIIVKPALGAIGGLFFGYLFLLYLGPKYDFLQIGQKFSDQQRFKRKEIAKAVPPQQSTPTPSQPPVVPKQPTELVGESLQNHSLMPSTKSGPLPVIQAPPISAVAPLKTDADRRIAAHEKKQQAIADGDLISALESIELLADLDGSDTQNSRADFLYNQLTSPTTRFSVLEIESALVYVLEEVIEEGRLEIAKKYSTQVLVTARKLKDRDLERRATLIVLMTK